MSSVIKNIVFDFGDVFINLDKQAIFEELGEKNSGLIFPPKLVRLNDKFEIGAIAPKEFISQWNSVYPEFDAIEISRIWNSILLDFPDYRLDFLEELATDQNYRLFLLSNTNALHIPKVEQIMGPKKFKRFQNCFERFYLSHEIGLRKPDLSVYEFVLNENKLVAEQTLFIDDTKVNTDAAARLGIKVWHLKVGKEDVVELKKWL